MVVRVQVHAMSNACSQILRLIFNIAIHSMLFLLIVSVLLCNVFRIISYSFCPFHMKRKILFTGPYFLYLCNAKRHSVHTDSIILQPLSGATAPDVHLILLIIIYVTPFPLAPCYRRSSIFHYTYCTVRVRGNDSNTVQWDT